MTAHIMRDSATLPATGDSAIALQDQLARCTRQLGDWVACPSGKTPEGQKIIANLRARIGSLEARMQNGTPTAAMPATLNPVARLSTLGSLVSVLA